MGFGRIFDVAGSGMNAQTLRLNTTASNIANAGSVAGDEQSVYRALQPVFSTELHGMSEGAAGVRVNGVVESQAPVSKLHHPAHPDADADGYVYTTNVNAVEEMVNMMSASRSYQNNVEVLKTSKELMLQTLSLGN